MALKIKVLLVDDRKENLFSLGSLLADLDLELFKASSGAAALGLACDHEFALAIVDVQMPEMDGFELAELMRGAERTKSVPIIFITAASATSGFSFKGYDSGAVDFLYKPIDSAMLRSKVRIFIELGQQKQLLLQQVERLKIAQAAAEAAKKDAERANSLKSVFLANVSHEIRTPLGAMIGFAELLGDATIPADEKMKYPEVIAKSGRTLLHLVDDILDLAKVESGHLQIEKSWFSPKAIVEEVFALLAPTAKAKGLELRFQCEGSPDRPIVSDPVRLRQILINMTGNAIKFAEAGSVTVSLETPPPDDQKSPVSFLIEDTGIGLDAEEASRIFQPFVQADGSIAKKFGGTGLGLALSRRLAQLLGGDVKLVSSQVGKGSKFRVSIENRGFEKQDQTPVGRYVEPAAPKTDDLNLTGIKVLVVEDSLDNQALLGILLSKKGAKLEFAMNGALGVEKALAGAFDLVLMDIQMPVMDGYHAVRLLRDRGYASPVIALTAFAGPEEREKCLKTGFDDYLSKPIDQARLFTTISAHAAL